MTGKRGSANNRTRTLVTITVMVFVLAACATNGGGPQPPAGPQIEVDLQLVPPVAELPGIDTPDPRPVAAFRDEAGKQVEFVANELWIASNDTIEIDDLLQRWGGEVSAVFEPNGPTFAGLAKQYLVRIDASAADTGGLGNDLLALDPNSSGRHQVSSESGLKLLAVAASEAAAGMTVGLNFVGRGSQFLDGASLEAPTGPPAYDPDVFTWPTHSSGSVQDIGVAEAWQRLEAAGALSNSVRIAILDMGFAPDGDTPNGFQSMSLVPTQSATGTPNLASCSGWQPLPLARHRRRQRGAGGGRQRLWRRRSSGAGGRRAAGVH